jgi:hypothetical protein
MQSCKITNNCIHINIFYKRKLGMTDELLTCREKNRGRRECASVDIERDCEKKRYADVQC